MEAATLSIRLFLATKAVLDAAVEAVELEIPGNVAVLASPRTWIAASIAICNL